MKSSAKLESIHQLINPTHLSNFQKNLFCVTLNCYFHKICLNIMYRMFYSLQALFSRKQYMKYLFMYFQSRIWKMCLALILNSAILTHLVRSSSFYISLRLYIITINKTYRSKLIIFLKLSQMGLQIVKINFRLFQNTRVIFKRSTFIIKYIYLTMLLFQSISCPKQS